tara:strand:- start:17 stop:199 length:183 start_codon:yes stop_codon:yes gene_type:complete
LENPEEKKVSTPNTNGFESINFRSASLSMAPLEEGKEEEKKDLKLIIKGSTYLIKKAPVD